MSLDDGLPSGAPRAGLRRLLRRLEDQVDAVADRADQSRDGVHASTSFVVVRASSGGEYVVHY